MNSEKLGNVFNLCCEMNTMGQRVFSAMSSIVEDPELRAYWKMMAADKAGLVNFWEVVIPLAEQGMIPDVFDNHDSLIEDLQHSLDTATQLMGNVRPGMEVKDGFLIALRLEYSLLHPGFDPFFHFACKLRPVAELNGGGECDGRIEVLLGAVERFCGDIPEMNLLSDTLKILWRENMHLALTINTDILTGVMNRRGFFNAARPFMDLARRDERNIGLILANIDDFKEFNARRGHDSGDLLLKQIGLALRQVVRSSDIVARFGGGEFIILFYSLAHTSLNEVARKVLTAIKGCTPDGADCTACVGAVSLKSASPEGRPYCVNLEEMLSYAAHSLDQAKRKGRDQIIVL